MLEGVIMMMAIGGLVFGIATYISENNKSLAQENEKVLTQMEATLSKSYKGESPKELLEFALSDAELFEEPYTVKEALPFPQGKTVSYRITETGDMIVALSPEYGVMCAARSVSGVLLSNCISKEDHPVEYKDPLNSIVDNPKVWTSETRPDYKERERRSNFPTILPMGNGQILVF